MKKNKNVLHTGMQGYYNKLNTEILEKPWKSIKVTSFHGTHTATQFKI